MVDITITDILLALFMARIIHAYISLFGKPQQSHSVWQTALWIAYLCFESLIFGLDSSYPLVTLTGNILFMTLLYRAANGTDLKTSVFHMGVFCTAWMAIEVATHSFLLFVTVDTKATYTLGRAITQLITYIAVQAYGRFMPKGKAAPLPLRCWLELFIAPMISVYVIYDAYSRSLEHGSNIGFVVVSLLESGHSDEAVGEIVEHGDGTIRSSKGPGELHGYGLVSVRKAVGKYNGDLVIRHGGGVFRASAILYPK